MSESEEKSSSDWAWSRGPISPLTIFRLHNKHISSLTTRAKAFTELSAIRRHEILFPYLRRARRVEWASRPNPWKVFFPIIYKMKEIERSGRRSGEKTQNSSWSSLESLKISLKNFLFISDSEIGGMLPQHHRRRDMCSERNFFMHNMMLEFEACWRFFFSLRSSSSGYGKRRTFRPLDSSRMPSLFSVRMGIKGELKWAK